MDKVKILENFVDDATCNHMIEVYNKLFTNVEKSEDNRKIIRNTKDQEILDFLRVYIPKVVEVLDKPYYIRDLLLSIYETGAYVQPHVDFTGPHLKHSLAILFYFSDEFEGGEVYFTNFPFEYKPKKGTLLIFPCNDSQYEHGVKPVTSGIRYTMPIEANPDKSLEVIAL